MPSIWSLWILLLLPRTSTQEGEGEPGSARAQKKEPLKTSRGTTSTFNLFTAQQTCSTSLVKKKRKKERTRAK